MLSGSMPHVNCYRVGNSTLLAGEYPYHHDPDIGIRRLTRFIEAGVTCFIDLSAPIDGMTPYEDEMHRCALERGRSACRHDLNVPDMGIPTIERMTEILDTIDGAVDKGETVYVHCWGGVGRTGTAVGCWLVRHGMSGDQALDTVASLFATMSPSKVQRHPEGSPQTQSQRRFVRTWTERSEAATSDPSTEEKVGESRRDAVRATAGTQPPQSSVMKATVSSLPNRLKILPLRAAVPGSNALTRLQNAGFVTVGDLDAVSHEDLLQIEGLGEKTALAVRSVLEKMRRGVLDPTLCISATMDAELRDIVSKALGPDAGRYIHILTGYHGLEGGDSLTLEAIASNHELTRERVRQLKTVAEDAVRDVLCWYRSHVFQALLEDIYQHGGLRRLEDLASAAADSLDPGSLQPEPYVRWLIEVSDDLIHLDASGTVAIGPPLGVERFEEGAEAVRQALQSSRTASTADIAAVLEQIWPAMRQGLLTVHADIVATMVGVEVLPGHYALVAWKRADWAEFVLDAAGEPLHFTIIAQRASALAEVDYTESGFNNVLNTDARFVRVGAGDFTLASWGARGYGRFDEVIKRYLQNANDCVHESVIIHDLLQTYTVAPTTVAAMLRMSKSLFTHFGGGYWGLAGHDYTVNDQLVDEIANILKGRSPRPAEYIADRLSTRSNFANVSLSDVTRALYVSPRFLRHGYAPVRFKLTHDLEPQADYEPPAFAGLPMTTDELLSPVPTDARNRFSDVALGQKRSTHSTSEALLIDPRVAAMIVPTRWSAPAAYRRDLEDRRAASIASALELRDRARGALIGLAVGDALGAAVEFQRPRTFTPVSDMRGGGPHHLKPGEWTDDTSLALCLAESIIEKRALDPHDQMQRYLRWYREGHFSSTGRCFDIGTTTRSAIESFARTGDPIVPRQDRKRAANGSLMRLAPVAVAFLSYGDVMERCAASSQTTHNAALPIDACRYFGGLIVGALEGRSRDELVSAHFSPRPTAQAHELEPEIRDVASGSFQRKQPPEIRGTGYCVESLEAALWAFNESTDFRSGALLAVNLGDDADTTGAIYGQIAGAYYGESDIPAEWRQLLARKDVLDYHAEFLFQLAMQTPLQPELSPERKVNADSLVADATQYGPPLVALEAIQEMRGDGDAFHSSMGALAAEEEALTRLRVRLGLTMVD